MPPGEFQHEELDTSKRQFRLVRVTGSEAGLIACEVRVFDFDGDDRPQYQALSYTW